MAPTRLVTLRCCYYFLMIQDWLHFDKTATILLQDWPHDKARVRTVKDGANKVSHTQVLLLLPDDSRLASLRQDCYNTATRLATTILLGAIRLATRQGASSDRERWRQQG